MPKATLLDRAILHRSGTCASEYSKGVGGKSTVMTQADVNVGLPAVYIDKGRSQAPWTFCPSNFNVFRLPINICRKMFLQSVAYTHRFIIRRRLGNGTDIVCMPHNRVYGFCRIRSSGAVYVITRHEYPDMNPAVRRVNASVKRGFSVEKTFLPVGIPIPEKAHFV